MFENLRQVLEEKTIRIPWTGCWIWMKAVDRDGYAKYGGTGANRNAFVHRLVHTAYNGDIPPGHHVDHLCNVRCCVNPAHLEAVTPKENAHRMIKRGGLRGWPAINAKATVCKRGHPFSVENTYVKPNGHRECRACRKL